MKKIDKSSIKIALISDTHVPDRELNLNPKIKKLFSNVDLIMHAGDITSEVVLHELGNLAPVIAVRGNQRGDSKIFKGKLPEAYIIELNNHRIGLIHGAWNFFHSLGDIITGRYLGQRKKLTQRVIKRISGKFPKEVKIVVFGHTHVPGIFKKDQRIYINPGTTTTNNFYPPSVGLLTITPDLVKPEIIYLDEIL